MFGGLSLNNASLTEVIDLLARQLKLNYILDPRIRGGVILNTYGETKDIDTRSLLDTILRLNGAGMVKQGDIYRIVPLTDISHLPIAPETKTDSQSIEERRSDHVQSDLPQVRHRRRADERVEAVRRRGRHHRHLPARQPAAHPG